MSSTVAAKRIYFAQGSRDMREPLGGEGGASPSRRVSNPTATSLLGTDDRAASGVLVAGEIARHAEFFSFGTNDLTQTGLGFSRDDIEAAIVPHYVETGILERSPFRVPIARVAAAQAAGARR